MVLCYETKGSHLASRYVIPPLSNTQLCEELNIYCGQQAYTDEATTSSQRDKYTREMR